MTKRGGSTSTTARAPERAEDRPLDKTAARSATVICAEISLLHAELLKALKPQSVPGLQLSPADCARVEDVLGLGATQSVESLFAAIDRVASIKVGDIRLPFTPGQLRELQHRAAKRGRTVEAEMRAVVARIEEELFYRGG